MTEVLSSLSLFPSLTGSNYSTPSMLSWTSWSSTSF